MAEPNPDVEKRLARLEAWAAAFKSYISGCDPNTGQEIPRPRAQSIDALPVVEDAE